MPGSWTLYVDGTPQSHVELERPDWLGFEYVRRIGHAIDLVRPEGAPITAVHLGGGALTLPRYVAATRPGSRQQVVELESDLVDLVREHLPLPATRRCGCGTATPARCSRSCPPDSTAPSTSSSSTSSRARARPRT